MMQTWNNFFIIIFWVTIISFVINIENFFKILLYSEITWLVLYCYIVLCGAINDDLNLSSSSFFILGFAALEFSIGILLVIIFKNVNKSISLNSDNQSLTNSNIFNTSKTYLNKFYWNIN